MNTETYEVKSIRVIWDNNRNRPGYLSNVQSMSAKNATIHKTSWTHNDQICFDLLIVWKDRKSNQQEIYIFSGDIIKLTISN